MGGPILTTNHNRDIPIGPYEGFRWHYEKDSEEVTGIVVSLDIWRRTETGKILWRFKYDTEKEG